GSLSRLWMAVPGKRTSLADPWLAVGRFLTIFWIAVMCFGVPILLAFWKGGTKDPQRQRTRFVWIWITPGLLFFTFVFLNYVNSGYLLVLCPPVFAWLAARGWAFLGSAKQGLWRRAAAGVAMAANCGFFFFAPVYCSQRGVREFERDLRGLLEDFRGVDPKNTLIVGFDSHFLGYRHAGYYFPGFATIQYPEVSYPDGKRVFVMHDRDTQVLRQFSTQPFERFLFFPLPNGADYSAYVDKIRGQLPGDALRSVTVGRRTVLAGPSWAIPLLFQTTAATS